MGYLISQILHKPTCNLEITTDRYALALNFIGNFQREQRKSNYCKTCPVVSDIEHSYRHKLSLH
jgi:hypothetical protein